MMSRYKIRMLPALVLGLALAACGGGEETRPMHDMPGMEGMEGMPGMEGMSGMEDTSAMHRHAEELDQMSSRMRQHIQEMRQLSPEQQHARMGEHVTQVARMLSLMNRQMHEMDMGMGMSDAQMGRMMGMSDDEHRRMMEEMQAIRTDVERLQTASRTAVRERMPAHLDRLDGMVQMMERSAAHMRSP
jgi:hypothetical protein